MLIRTAALTDIDFIAEAIIGADKSGTGVSSYCRIFEIPEDILRRSIKLILAEDFDGFDIGMKCFRIAEIDHDHAGAVSSWIEGMDGIASGTKKLSAFSFVLKGKNSNLKNNLEIISEISIAREPGTLQLESVFTRSQFRGLGIAGKLINHHIELCRSAFPSVQKAQIQVMQENEVAVRTYQNLGFEIKETKTSGNPHITEFLPGRKKLMLEKSIID
jgi:ribosomal protein S18 acetylase RimI-like enzyme